MPYRVLVSLEMWTSPTPCYAYKNKMEMLENFLASLLLQGTAMRS
jgi:hypothetical protein